MADWQKRSTFISGDVIFFEYVTSKLVRNSEVVYVWDIDKTYLDTHFESLKGLIKTALEKAFQKRNVPGTSSLVRALTSSRAESESEKPFPIYFITASPPQMEKKIRLKLELDGIKPYGAFFKDNLRNLRPRHFWKLNKQVGYKLQALLELRTRMQDGIRQILWGDDSESDAIIYSLYSDICARRLSEDEIRHILEKFYVSFQQREYILELQSVVPESDPVEKIYINLADDTDPDYYAKFGKRTLATFNTFQIALDLYQDERLTGEKLIRVGQDMIMNYGFTQDELSKAVDDLLMRGMLVGETAEKLIPILQKNHLVPPKFKLAKHRAYSSPLAETSWIPQNIDYLNDFR